MLNRIEKINIICVFVEKEAIIYCTLPETNSSHLKIDGCKMRFLLGPGRFLGAFAGSFRQSIHLWLHVLSLDSSKDRSFPVKTPCLVDE